jgi:hypothetical protein
VIVLILVLILVGFLSTVGAPLGSLVAVLSASGLLFDAASRLLDYRAPRLI